MPFEFPLEVKFCPTLITRIIFLIFMNTFHMNSEVEIGFEFLAAQMTNWKFTFFPMVACKM